MDEDKEVQGHNTELLSYLGLQFADLDIWPDSDPVPPWANLFHSWSYSKYPKIIGTYFQALDENAKELESYFSQVGEAVESLGLKPAKLPTTGPPVNPFRRHGKDFRR